MAPIRLALIGLSSSAKTSWASSAHLPYLLSARGKARYTIVALCNSSIEAAQRAVSAYNLPSTTKTYGDPQSLADDPDVDMVVCCTRVDVHHETILPSVKKGKSVFVEWPLAQDAEHVEELQREAQRAKARTLMGMQGRFAPVIVKIKALLEGERIGKVLSSEYFAHGGTNDREAISTGLQYFADRKVGGNIYTIGFGHLFDQIQHVFGDLEGLNGVFQRQRPVMKLRDPKTGDIVGTIESDMPDLFITTSNIPSSRTVRDGATLLTRFRRGQPFPNTPHLLWTIHGEKGELRLSAWGGTGIHAHSYDKPVTIEIHDFETDEVQAVDWEWANWQEQLPFVARSIGKLYEEFAQGNKAVPNFEDAARRHAQLNEMLGGWKA